jgi:hypothetical protein
LSDESIKLTWQFAFQLRGATVYNKVMARGWESKSVEAQIEDNRYDEHKAHLSRAEMELRRKKESLLLSRTRIIKELETSRNPRYKKILTDALADLDEKLAEFD